ncbi:hypothetical protein GCM10023149_21020 [Mucilaginibacter gynuensis]|uniref:Uncharacterized protein n=1 Tax=Mucilaginibacter gynuensis TaxID=1302236 RepID=A0ABP8GCB2_9SPHI
MNGYYKIFANIPNADYESSVAWLENELEYYLIDAYEERFDDADIRPFQ